MTSDNIIQLQNISKRFYSSQTNCDAIQVLENISFEINSGSITGIIGENGSGKSTLLKIIGGIIKPNTGQITIRGKVVSILELGTGFHPDLTGLENIKYYFQLLGFSNYYTSKIAQKIITFSDLGQYIHEPIKHYSSGMNMRLAFSVIVHLPADLFLLDEVFSVGDQSFRIKCMNKIRELSKEGKTFLLVSHDLYLIGLLCNQIIYLKDRNISLSTHVKSSIDEYLLNVKSNNLHIVKKDNYCIWNNPEHNSLISSIKTSTQKDCFELNSSEQLELTFEIKKISEENIYMTFVINYGLDMGFLAISPNFSGVDNELQGLGLKKITCSFPANTFNEGLFTIDVFVMNYQESEYFKIENISTFIFRRHNYTPIESKLLPFTGPMFYKDVWKKYSKQELSLSPKSE